MAVTERHREATPHEDLVAGNLAKVLPVRTPDFDNAAKTEPEMLHGRLNTTFVTNWEDTAPPPREAEPKRLPKELPEAPREERAPGPVPTPEEVRRRLPEDLPAQKAATREKRGETFDVLDEEARSAPSGRRAGKKAKDEEGDILF